MKGKCVDVLYASEVNEKVLEFAPDCVNFQWEYSLYDARKVAADLNILRKKGVQTNVTLHGFSDYDLLNELKVIEEIK